MKKSMNCVILHARFALGTKRVHYLCPIANVGGWFNLAVVLCSSGIEMMKMRCESPNWALEWGGTGNHSCSSNGLQKIGQQMTGGKWVSCVAFMWYRDFSIFAILHWSDLHLGATVSPVVY